MWTHDSVLILNDLIRTHVNTLISQKYPNFHFALFSLFFENEDFTNNSISFTYINRLHTHIFVHTHVHTCMHTCEHTHTNTCVHIHLHTHTKNDVLEKQRESDLSIVNFQTHFQILYSTFSSQNLSQQGRQPLQDLTCFGFFGFSQVSSSIIKLFMIHPDRVLGSSYAQISPRSVV